jgi:hypothetical protein
MPHTAAELLEQARKLPLAERHWLVDTLTSENDQAAEEAFAAWQKEVGEPEPGYEEWFRADVEEALAGDPSSDIPHGEAMRQFHEAILKARKLKHTA